MYYFSATNSQKSTYSFISHLIKNGIWQNEERNYFHMSIDMQILQNLEWYKKLNRCVSLFIQSYFYVDLFKVKHLHTYAILNIKGQSFVSRLVKTIIYTCVYICIYINTFIYIWLYIWTYMYTFVYVYSYRYKYECTYLYKYLQI